MLIFKTLIANYLYYTYPIKENKTYILESPEDTKETLQGSSMDVLPVCLLSTLFAIRNTYVLERRTLVGDSMKCLSYCTTAIFKRTYSVWARTVQYIT